ncbi:hypothetical protein GE061_010826 [Apolygus lucorum]|uniref:Rhodanese domain-containing protein n=1 Tax=Apolygus lucorum TaxID=248454 RepID=A0A8S9XXT9_APOLU|nr:hypothetical protein GE061_010826 [Apolygus lucorum]
MSLVFRRCFRVTSVVFTRSQTSSLQNCTQIISSPNAHYRRHETSQFSRLMATAVQPNVVNLSIPEVLEAGKNGVPIIDVRELVEIHNTGLIPGSVNIPLGHLIESMHMEPRDFKERYTIERPGKNDKIILSCQSGNRSMKAITALQADGFTNLLNNAGGWKAYEEFKKGK